MKNQNPTNARFCIGKIGRLPHDIREQLNRRLLHHEPAYVILPWLNALLPVQKILAGQLTGKPITAQNLSNWRATGFQRWLQDRQPSAEPGSAPETSDLNSAQKIELQDNLRVAANFYLRLLGDEQAKRIITASLPEVEKTELLGRHIFGENWIPLSK